MALVGVGLVVVGVVGFAVSLYFTLVTYRVMRPDPRWLPPVCRMDEAACARVVDTRYARVLGLPNSAYGLAWYVLLTAAGAVLLAGGLPAWACVALGVAAAGTVVLSAYLAWSLLVVLGTTCVLCFTSHGLNVAGLVLVVAACATGG